jgi:hypothetical protein
MTVRAAAQPSRRTPRFSIGARASATRCFIPTEISNGYY